MDVRGWILSLVLGRRCRVVGGLLLELLAYCRNATVQNADVWELRLDQLVGNLPTSRRKKLV